ncbi:MAG TPA: undecaprenyl-diphosphate phosphatase [Opitutaceae bacterium]|nr:undecaprenyl-diphosphate phosphatase [Opitutaceae bacterium]
MPLSLFQIVVLGLIQGAAELLPVSSSAHVIVAEKLMHLDPTAPEMTFLLVMLHTGTMFAVIAYFWKAWQGSFCSNREQLRTAIGNLAIATVYTLAIAFTLKVVIEKVWAPNGDATEIESLFGNLTFIAAALAAVGVFILVAGLAEKKDEPDVDMSFGAAGWIGVVQGLAIPFRGFSRSGSTISTGLLLKVNKPMAEQFSFALGVILTPAAIGQELLRLLKARHEAGGALHLGSLLAPGLIGMVCSFLAGLLALRLLSNLLKGGRWWWFGLYCLAFAAAVFALARSGL